jgi:uncharacterized Zn finger protein
MVTKLKKKGLAIEPVAIEGRTIATTFWGKAWCAHLESLSDFQNRLPRGRTYVRRGAVIHLALDSGRILAKVQGSSLYDIEIGVAKLQPRRWTRVVAGCTGSISSLVELLRGNLSEAVMQTVTNVDDGLFPAASEIRMSCSCPDWAGVCKHLAAVLYGVGARLDARPELLFTLRGVDPSELVAAGAAAAVPDEKARGQRSRRVLPSSALADVFGLELEQVTTEPLSTAPSPAPDRETKRAPSRGGVAPTKLAHDVAPVSRVAAVVRKPARVPKRRNMSDVAACAELVLKFVKSNPGVGIEVIGQRMQLSTQELSLPIRKLVATGSLVSVGERRATKYFAASSPPNRRRQRK